MRFGAAGLRYNLNDAPAGVTVLRLEATGLYLHFLYEGEVNAGSQSAIGARPNTEAAEGRVVDGNAIRYVGVLQSAGAGNRWIVRARLQAINRSRAKIKQAGDTPLHGDILVERIREFRVEGRCAGINRDRGRTDFHGLGDLAGFQDYLDAGGLVDEDLSALYARDFKARFFHLDRVNAGDQG